MSRVEAKFVFGSDTVFETKLPPAEKLSDSIAELRQQAGAFLTTFLASHNQSTEEVDIMEETVEEDGAAGKNPETGGGKRRKEKRKR